VEKGKAAQYDGGWQGPACATRSVGFEPMVHGRPWAGSSRGKADCVNIQPLENGATEALEVPARELSSPGTPLGLIGVELVGGEKLHLEGRLVAGFRRHDERQRRLGSVQHWVSNFGVRRHDAAFKAATRRRTPNNDQL
jgi:hypothetical protein